MTEPKTTQPKAKNKTKTIAIICGAVVAVATSIGGVVKASNGDEAVELPVANPAVVADRVDRMAVDVDAIKKDVSKIDRSLVLIKDKLGIPQEP